MILQPRSVITIMLTILCFVMLVRDTQTLSRHIHPADFNLRRTWDAAEGKAMQVENRVVNYYENIRFVYRFERRLKDLQKQEGSERERKFKSVRSHPNKLPQLFETSERWPLRSSLWGPSSRRRS